MITGTGSYSVLNAEILEKLKWVNSGTTATDDDKVHIDGLYEMLSDFTKPIALFGEAELNLSLTRDLYNVGAQFIKDRYTRGEPYHIVIALTGYRPYQSGELVRTTVDLCCDETGAWLTRGD